METSEQVNELYTALSKFSGVAKPPQKTGFNPFTRSKYAGISEVKAAIRPALAECGLALIQATAIAEHGVGVTTTIAHASGQWCRSLTILPVTRAEKGGKPAQIALADATVQEIGSALTYASRYAILTMLCLAGDDDDDGNSASGRYEPERQQEQRHEQRQQEQRPAQTQQKPQDFPNHKITPTVTALVADLPQAETAQHFAEIAGVLQREHGEWAATPVWVAFKAAVAAREIKLQTVWETLRLSQQGGGK